MIRLTEFRNGIDDQGIYIKIDSPIYVNPKMIAYVGLALSSGCKSRVSLEGISEPLKIKESVSEVINKIEAFKNFNK